MVERDEGGRGADLLVYHRLVDEMRLVHGADDVKVDGDRKGRARIGGVGRYRSASDPMRGVARFVQLHMCVVELGARRSGAACSLGDLLLGGDVDGQEEEDGQQRAERAEKSVGPHPACLVFFRLLYIFLRLKERAF